MVTSSTSDFFFWLILGCFGFGLLISVERLWALRRASIDRRRFFEKLTGALEKGGVNAAIAVCAQSRSSLANMIYAGLLRSGKGVERVEQALATSGAIEMGLLEKNLVWLVFVVSVAPMLGFIGTVIGIIGTFNEIASSNNLSPVLIAGGISQALQPTVLGLVAGITIQGAHTYCVTRIDRIVTDMEAVTQALLDILVEKKIV